MKNNVNDASPLVSVIIPVYNSVGSIGACLRSVTAQTYPRLQIVVVNDGSRDGSLDVIGRCAAADGRIVCVDQPNAGTNLARKAGLDVATGKYVQYLDADDELLPDAIERLVQCAESTSADIVSAPFVLRFEDGREEPSPVLQVDEIGGRDYFRKIFDWQGATWNMWGNFQKRSLVYDYGIDILPDVPYGQDATWMIQIFFRNPKIVPLKTPILYYNRNPLSVSYSRSAADRRYRGSRRLYSWFEGYLEELGLSDQFRRERAILQMEMTFTCIHALRLGKVRGDMKTLIRNVGSHPELLDRLSGVNRELLEAFLRSELRGWARLIRYRAKGRL